MVTLDAATLCPKRSSKYNLQNMEMQYIYDIFEMPNTWNLMTQDVYSFSYDTDFAINNNQKCDRNKEEK